MEQKFEWKQSHMGGGGFITGLIQDPQNPDTIYTRCDVAGVFKSTDCGKTFRPVNNGMAECHHHSVRSIAIAPHDSNILFRCSGDARGGKLFGSIHKSCDGGESWYEVCRDADFYGNGPTRMYGEVIAVNPQSSSIVAAGGYSKGLFISKNGGESFHIAGLEGERITNVMFHPFAKNRLYVCTVSDKHISGQSGPEEMENRRTDEVLRGLHDFSRKNDARIYVSQNYGESFEVLCEGYNVAELAFDPENTEVIYAAASSHGVLKTFNGGKTWRKLANGLSDRLRYNTITVDPLDPNILYTCPDLRGHHTFVPNVTIYKSVDKGESWGYLKEYTFDDFYEYPKYITLRHIGWAIAKIRADVKNPDRLFMSNWFGMSVSNNGGTTWSGNNFEGTETTCIENVLCDPTVPGKVYFTIADHGPEYSVDNGITYKSITNIGGFTSSTSLVSSRFRPEVLIYGAVVHRAGCSGILRSTDGGETLEVVQNFDEGMFVQALAEDYFNKGTFYAFIDGAIENGAGLYKSSDWGQSWKKMSNRFPEYIKTLPYEKRWIEADLLPVVVYQVKNVCGTNQLLAADPHMKDTLYLGEWTEGLFRITEGGEVWENIGTNLPFKQDKTSVLNVVKVDENVPGRIYAGFIKEGLWKSDDYGHTWTKIYPLDCSSVNVSSLALDGGTEKRIYIASEPLYWTGNDSSIFCSLDEGKTWIDIMDKSLGAVRWKGIAVDRQSGRVHAVSCGNGAFYGDFIQE